MNPPDPKTRKRRLLRRCAAAAGALAIGVGAYAAATSTGLASQNDEAEFSEAVLKTYVALGDSYASGVGAGDYIGDDDCYRSNHAYPVQAADQIFEGLWFDACSGATVDDVLADQLGNLGGHTDYVTVGVGGNDAGFSTVLGACAGTDTDLCLGAIDSARTVITEVLPGTLDGLYATIADEAPDAHVVVVGNPRLFSGETCDGTLAITPEEQAELNDAADLLAETTAAVAADHGFEFADVREAFTGHEVCSEDAWILGYVGTLESFHPNAAGQDGYTEVVVPLLKS